MFTGNQEVGPERLTPNIGRLVVETKYFPLYEIRNGREYRITYRPKGLPVRDYLLPQGCFKHLTKNDLEAMQEEVEENWEEVKLSVLKGELSGKVVSSYGAP